MSSLTNRLAKLEKQRQPAQERAAWAEIGGDGRAVLRYQDGRREDATEADIPPGTKIYTGSSPDDWDKPTTAE